MTVGGSSFNDPGELRDGDLELMLIETTEADVGRGWVPAYHFAICEHGRAARCGHVSLRAGNSERIKLYAGHIGYGVAREYRGRHYAERATRLLFPLARKHGISELWITCNPDNWPSRRTCERLGGKLVETVKIPPDIDMYYEGEREKCRYLILL